MAEQMPQGQEDMQAKFEAMVKEIGPLMEVLQGEASPEEKLKAAKRIMEILSQLKEVLPPDKYAEQFGQLEMQIQQVLGQLEG